MKPWRWLLFWLVGCSSIAFSQPRRPFHPPPFLDAHEAASPARETATGEHAAWHAERRRLHEAWRAMPPEERRRLRRDIEEASDQLYPWRGGHHPHRRSAWPQE